MQNKNYKEIPIIIISYNQLYYLKKLVNYLLESDFKNIIILDNNSTYKPLLSYFDKIDNKVRIHRLTKNYGHKVFWDRKDLFDQYSKGYYVITDADIFPDKNCPSDFMLYFKKILDKNIKLSKVGFSLELDDIPETNVLKNKIISWEKRFWKNQTKQGNFLARIDTTFALYPPKSQWFMRKDFYHAIRTKKPYVAKHGGWYLDSKNLNEEQLFYSKTASSSSSWNLSSKGDFTSKVCY